jgi:hypothetical protein
MRLEPDDLVVVYDPNLADRLAAQLIEFARMGLTMVPGDPSKYVQKGETASAVVVSGGMVTGEGEWTTEHVKRLADLARNHQGTVEWVRCPECRHEHYDGYGGVPCGEPGCACERSYMPRSG